MLWTFGWAALLGCTGPEKHRATPVDSGPGTDTGTDTPPCSSRFYADADGDGYGDPDASTVACAAPAGMVTDADDCNDADGAIHPSADEVCDDLDVDENCDGLADDASAKGQSGYFTDADGDGYGDADAPTSACDPGAGLSTEGTDCDDRRDDINPSAPELCANDVDEDCDGSTACGKDVPLTSVAARLTGEHELDFAGEHLSRAGDLNGDGMQDLLVGAIGDSTTDVMSGAAYVVLGPFSGDKSLADAHAKLLGEAYGDYAGFSVAGGGDLDGDGADDILVGSMAGPTTEGITYLVLGPVTGDLELSKADATFTGGEAAMSSYSLATGDLDGDGHTDVIVGTLDWLYSDGTGMAQLLLGPVSGSVDLSTDAIDLLPDSSGCGVGASISTGDTNGDGIDDLLLGSPCTSSTGTYAGAAYFVEGPIEGDLDLGTADAMLYGEAAFDNAGHAVAIAPDVDGDGNGDLIVGAYNNSSGGAAYLVHGPSKGVVSLAKAAAKMTGSELGDMAGKSVAGAGDVNGDGNGDVLIGAGLNERKGVEASGTAYLVFGPMSGGFDLSVADLRLAGQPGEDASVVVALGDADGDGLNDIGVGARANSEAGDRAGAAYVVLGGSL